MSWTVPNVYASILSKWLIAHMGFPRLGGAFYTQTAHECTESQLFDVRHAWYVVSQCRPIETGGLKGGLQLKRHSVIWGSIISCNSKQMADGTLKWIMKVL